MNPTTGVPIITELVIELVTAVGVGNFIIITLVLSLVMNLPTIITGVNNLIKNKRANLRLDLLQEKITSVEISVDSIESGVRKNANSMNLQTNEIKALVAIVDLLHSALDRESSERREENSMITYSLEKLSSALESIDKIMRNVISEEDTSRLLTFVMGIEKSLRNSLLEKSMEMVDHFESGVTNGGLEEDLKNDLFSEWSDFKSELSQFNTPINIVNFFDAKEADLWKEHGMFAEIVRIAKLSPNKVEKQRKKDAISKRLNIGLRRLHADLANYLKQGRQHNGSY